MDKAIRCVCGHTVEHHRISIRVDDGDELNYCLGKDVRDKYLQEPCPCKGMHYVVYQAPLSD